MFSNNPQNKIGDTTMKKEELFPIIEENLANIYLGQTFSTETKLYKALNLPMKKGDGNKTLREAVQLYVKWELSDPEGRSRQIVVTSINATTDYVDGRINNGGAHNVKYGPIIKPALLNYQYGDFITYKQICTRIYGFSEKEIAYSRDTNKRIKKYKDNLYSKLKAITNTALDGLMREKLLKYQSITVIRGNKSYIEPIDITPDVVLSDLLKDLYGATIGLNILNELENALNTAVDEINSIKQQEDAEFYKPIESICLESLLLVKFLDLIGRKVEFWNAIKNIVRPFKQMYDINIATEGQVQTIKNLEITICNHLKFSCQDMNFDGEKRMRVYRRAQVFYWLLGWDKVYKALQIKPTSNPEKYEQYSLENFSRRKLLDVLEPQIIKWVAEKNKYNPLEVATKKMEKVRHFGRGTSVPIGEDVDIYYMANDSKVNLLHCKIFGHEPDKKFFKSYIPNEEP